MASIKRKEYRYNGRRVILDASEIHPGEYETMLMYTNGNEIDCKRAYSAKAAEKDFSLFLANYPAEEVPLNGKYAKLRDDLKKALASGVAAEKADPEDGGTCNFDSAALFLPRWSQKQVERAAKEAGTFCSTWDLFGKRHFVFCPQTRSQGNARSRNAEAVTAALSAMGYDAIDYCQMD